MFNLYRSSLKNLKLPNINNNNNNNIKSNLVIRSYTTININGNIKNDDNNNNKFYSLSQFPYPSGALHMGHVRVYTISDCIARLKRMQGYDVIHPMGWDAFGLPAENAAIDKQVSPSEWTNLNINSMRDQLKLLNFQFDWDRELSTCNKDYYRWTQEIFLRLLKSGLAYRKSATVNWDPIDQTVLANEQVDAQGRSWRSNAIVEKKEMKQWFYKITSMADRLTDDLDQLPGWSDEIKNMQKEWIGRSYGHLIEFQSCAQKPLSNITVFTTRAETIYGVSFLAISPHHSEINQIRANLINDEKRLELDQYLKEIQEIKNKMGAQEDVENLKTFNTGLTFYQPITKKYIPLILSNFVHADYGTGAVMGVPSHNRSDYQVAKQQNLKLLPVLGIEREQQQQQQEIEEEECYDYSNTGKLINSGQDTGIEFKEFIKRLEDQQLIKRQTNYRIHDWLISRQRYWGTPIPIIVCEKCGDVPVPSDQLPVELPIDIQFTGKGNLLNQLDHWKNVKCPCCGSQATRETDTMDTFVDSSWYFLRFLDSKNSQSIFSSELVNRFMPVDVYVGGIEHAILHLLYSRFITKFLKDQQLIDHSEPFKVLLAQGLVKSPTYRDSITNKPIHPSNVEFKTIKSNDSGKSQQQTINKLTGNQVSVTIEKMSKSKLNGIDPKEIIDKYGSDTLKTYILFKAPPEKSLDWDTQGIEGCKKWLTRINVSIQSFLNQFDVIEGKEQQQQQQQPLPSSEFNEQQSKEVKDILFETHSTMNKVTESIDKHSFNTGIAALMELSNTLQKSSPQIKLTKEYYQSLRALTLMLFPFSPIFSQIHWKSLIDDLPQSCKSFYSENYSSFEQQSYGISNDNDIFNQRWPKPTPSALVRDFNSLVIQFDGKTKGVESIPTSITDFSNFVQSNSKYSNRFKDKTIDQIFIGTTKTGNSINFTFEKK
ncbi:hypothetical protein ACTFIW_010398 [Dictyostelium discoideum]